MDPVKEAFQKVKEDMAELRMTILDLQQEIVDVKRTLNNQTIRQTDSPTHIPTEEAQITAFQHINPTDNYTPTHNLHLRGLKTSNFNSSIGNKGVPTDRQINQQTDRQTTDTPFIVDNSANLSSLGNLITSIDTLKSEVRLSIKSLTNQETTVLLTLYQLEQEQNQVDYPLMAQKLGLSESSIRDYTQKIIKKGIPIQKIKENNKKIFLTLSSDFRKLVSFSAIIAIREI